jgi:hypothetical protein
MPGQRGAPGRKWRKAEGLDGAESKCGSKPLAWTTVDMAGHTQGGGEEATDMDGGQHDRAEQGQARQTEGPAERVSLQVRPAKLIKKKGKEKRVQDGKRRRAVHKVEGGLRKGQCL